MSIESFVKALGSLATEHGVQHLFVYCADAMDSGTSVHGLPPEACHGILQALTSSYAETSAKIAKERFEARHPKPGRKL